MVVALSHCDKDLFCLSHWVTATNQFFVCCTKSLWQRKLVYVFKKRCPKGPNMLHFLVLFALLGIFCAFYFGNLYAFLYFVPIFKNILAFFVQHILKLLVAVSQCDKQKIHLLQWLSVTNKTNLCYIDSMRQTVLKNIQFLCSMLKGKRIGKKAKNKHPFKF